MPKKKNLTYKVEGGGDSLVDETSALPTTSKNEEIETVFSFRDLISKASQDLMLEKANAESEYCDTDYIGSSAAIIECLWSKFALLCHHTERE